MTDQPDDAVTASGVDVTDDTSTPTSGVTVAASTLPSWFRPGVIAGTVCTVVLVAISLATALLYLAPTVDRLARASDVAATERAVLEVELRATRADVADEQEIEDCRGLYLDDIRRASALSQIALSDLFAGVVEAPADTNADETAERNRRLVAELEAANEPLRTALDALDEYVALAPPPGVCPHPKA